MSGDSTDDEEARLAEEFAAPFIERERQKRLAELRTKEYEEEADATWRAQAAQEPFDMHLRSGRSLGRQVLAMENLDSQLRNVEDFGEMLRSENMLEAEGRRHEKSHNAAGYMLPSSERFILSPQRDRGKRQAHDYPHLWHHSLAFGVKDAKCDEHVSTREPSLPPLKTLPAPRTPLLSPTIAEVSQSALKFPHFIGDTASSTSFSASFDSSGSSSGSTVRHARQIFAEDRAVFLEEQRRMTNHDIMKSTERPASRPDHQLHRISELSTIASSAGGSSRSLQGSVVSAQSQPLHDRTCISRQEPLPSHRISQAPTLKPFVGSSATAHGFAQGVQAQERACTHGAGQYSLHRFATPPAPAPTAVSLQHVQR